MEEDNQQARPSLRKHNTHITPAMIYTWLTDFEDQSRGPKGKQPMKGGNKSKSTPISSN
ncbi:hypothetical protein CHS0354_020822, partial [Potamilus streckersoni]